MQRQDRATTNRDWRECLPHSCQAVHPKAARHARLEIFLTGLRKWPQKQQSDPFRDFADYYYPSRCLTHQPDSELEGEQMEP